MGMRADLQAIIVRYGHDRHCLVQILRETQDLDGWLAPANRNRVGDLQADQRRVAPIASVLSASRSAKPA